MCLTYQYDITMTTNRLAEATRLAQNGQINASIQTLQQQVAATGTSYPIATNLAALHLQVGDLQSALLYCSRAIEIDPYCHSAYFNRFLCYISSKNLQMARR